MESKELLQLIHQSNRLALFSQNNEFSQMLNRYLSSFSPENLIIIDSLVNEQFIKKNLKLSENTDVWGYSSYDDIEDILKHVGDRRVILNIGQRSPFVIERKVHSIVNRRFDNTIYLKDGHYKIMKHHSIAQ